MPTVSLTRFRTLETMAEIAMTLLIDKLVQLLVQEAKLLNGVHREVVGISDELESIMCFLKDVDAKAKKGGDLQDGMKVWVKQVREATFHIEDVLDEYILHVAQHSHQHGFFVAFLHKIGCLLKKLKPHHDIAIKIKDIKTTIRKIKERKERYSINSLEQRSCGGATNATWHDPRMGSLFIEEGEVVGIESTRGELVSWLLGNIHPKYIIKSDIQRQ
jgi:disease resistance protein RPM1